MSYLGNEQQMSLNELGANQAMQMQKSRIPYSQRKTKRTLSVILTIVLVVICIIYALDRIQTREKLYICYNGVLYEYSGFEATQEYAEELGVVNAGTVASTGKSYKNLSIDFETNDKNLGGSMVGLIPGSSEQIFIENEDGEYTILVPVSNAENVDLD